MFIAIPVGMNYRTERFPIVTITLVGINTLVYVVSMICSLATKGASDDWIFQHLWLIPANSVWFTYLTSMFVHAGFLHLFGNMIFLFLFGACVEDLVGRWRFIGSYLLGGLAAELTYIVMSPDHFASEIPMGGASGAIGAVMGMYLLLRADAEIEFKYVLWFFFVYFRAGEFEIPAWIAIVFWFLSNLLWAVVGMLNQHSGGGVAFGAHVGGLLAGIAMMGIGKLIQRGRARALPDERIELMPKMAPVAVQQPASTGETPTIYLHEGGVQSGPFTLSQVQVALAGGTIGKDAVYWSEGMTDWQSVMDLAGGPLE